MPPDSPELEGFQINVGCRPGREPQRHYLHFFRLSSNRLAVVIADFVGFAPIEKITRAQLSREVASCLANESDLGRAIEHLNDRMVGFSGSRFLTLLAFVLSGSSGDVFAVNAGHYGPLIFRASRAIGEKPFGDEIDLPIAIDKGIDYSAINLSFLEGDTAVLFSDGVPETPNSEFELFGVDSIGRLLAMSGDAETIRDRIMKGVKEHIEASEQHDGITLVVIQRIKDR